MAKAACYDSKVNFLVRFHNFYSDIVELADHTELYVFVYWISLNIRW